ncbi:hypothetical protein [Marinobacter sp. BGYM27]|nr:hypothetical protein [Marinobacter sp. BGYM27]MDG5498924.1 hypothetical protein [Marinobacter sp. BGYM27]
MTNPSEIITDPRVIEALFEADQQADDDARYSTTLTVADGEIVEVES